MTTKPTLMIRVKEIDGEPMLDGQCMALLFGVTVADVRALPIADGTSLIPREWLRRGRRHLREHRAPSAGRDPNPRKTSHEVKCQAASWRGGGNATCSS